MTNKTKKLIELAERAKCVEGSEKWSLRLGVRVNGLTKIVKKSAIGGYRTDGGPLLPHNPLDPMNLAACLRRAGCYCYISTDAEFFLRSIMERVLCWLPQIPTYADYMEALLNLHDLAKSEGGEWAEVWARAMTPDGNTEEGCKE